MSAANINFADVPPVLPGSENEEVREKLLELAAQSSAGFDNACCTAAPLYVLVLFAKARKIVCLFSRYKAIIWNDAR